MAIINNYPTYLRVTTQNLARAFFITKPFTVVKYNDTTIKIEDSFYENVIIKTEDLTGFTFTDIDDLINQLRIISTNTDQISVVNTYSDLPAASTLPNRFFFVRLAQGTKWLPLSFGGTYYPNGTYYSDGSQWISNVDLYTSIQKITGSVVVANPTANPETGLAKESKQDEEIGLLTSIDGKDFATEATLLTVESNTANLKDIIQEISTTGFYRGKVGYVFHILGARAGFTSTSGFNDIKEFDNSVADIPVLSNSTLDLISSDVADTAGGAGVQSVRAVYINSSNNIVQSGDLIPNGTTVVPGVLTGVNEVLWLETEIAGGLGVAAGNIRLRIGGTATEVEQISAGGNKSLSARAMIPAGFSGYIDVWDTACVNNDQDYRLRGQVRTLDRTLCATYHFADRSYIALNQNRLKRVPFLKFPPLCKIKISTKSAGTASTVRADVSFTLVLIQD